MSKAQRHIAPAKSAVKSETLTVIIPAAGVGKRMKSKGPKALLPVCRNMSVLELQLRTLVSTYENVDIIVVGGFECEKIRDELWGMFPFRIVRNTEYETTNVSHSVAIGLEASLLTPTLIIHGDLVFNQLAIKGLIRYEASAMLAVGTQLDVHEVGIGVQDGFVTTLSYALADKWGQMAYLQGKEIQILRDLLWHNKQPEQWFLYESLNYVINNGGRFVAHQPPGAKIVEIDKLSDIDKAKTI